MTPPRLSIALIAGTALAYEVLLMRLFAIIQWHHFAYMIISLALLGYGASGTFLTLTRQWLHTRFSFFYIANLLLYACATVACFIFVQKIPFNPQEVLWDLHQPMWLLTIYLLLTLPFFFAANCIGLVLTRFPKDISRVYAADLLGAGLGSIIIIALLFVVFPQNALLTLATLVIVASAVAWFELGLRPRWIIGVLSIVVVLPWCIPAQWTQPVFSPYKALSQLLQINGTRIVGQSSSPLGFISIVESTVIPLRHAPGLSLRSSQWPSEQRAVFTDGDAMTTITRNSGDISQLTYLDYLTSALPYHLTPPKSLLVLGTGGGSSVLQARYHGVAKIDAVELNPELATLLLNEYADFSGNLFESNNSTLHIAEARGFVATQDRRYDLIQISLMDSFNASAAGLYALSEGYLYTLEAFVEYMEHLSKDGFLAISRWIRLPPRDTLKLFATAVTALESMGIEHPEDHLVLIRSWQTSTLLIKNTPYSSNEIEALRRFCRKRSFDVSYFPGMGEAETNHYNRLEQPYFYQGAQALLGEQRDAFMANYKFHLQPATDNKPYFFHFFKWRVAPELISLRGQGGLAFFEMGYPILVTTLLQAVVASFVLILLPLIIMRSNSHIVAASIRRKGLLYFSMLGMAFLFIEMAFIQKFTLFLHHPLYAISVVLAAFLLFAGIGSAYSQRFVVRDKLAKAIRGAIITIVTLCLGYLLLLAPLFDSLMGVQIIIKIIVAVALIAPLGFCMGIPFPLGLAKFNRLAPEIVPWLWGINGCASVVSTILATILAIHIGFSFVILLASVFYCIAAVSIPTNNQVIN